MAYEFKNVNITSIQGQFIKYYLHKNDTYDGFDRVQYFYNLNSLMICNSDLIMNLCYTGTEPPELTSFSRELVVNYLITFNNF